MCLFLISPNNVLADIVTMDSDMESSSMDFWPHADVAGANSSTKSTDFSNEGNSLKGTSGSGFQMPSEWYNQQNLGIVADNNNDLITLSLWYGLRYNFSAQAASGTLSVDISPTGVNNWTNIWSSGSLIPSTSFQSDSVTDFDVSTYFSTGYDYDMRLHFSGSTGRHGAANIEVWWDDVELNVVSQSPPVVPEPISSTLFIVGGATLGMRRLRKK
jgi:hypothetical protein